MLSGQVILFSVLAYPVWCIIYNLYFHPLRDYPGPLLNRASGLPRMVARLRGMGVYQGHDAHEKYGYIVRLSPNELSYIHHDAWKDIYAHQVGNRYPLPKEPVHNPQPPDLVHGMLTAPTPAEHGRQRAIFNPAFSDRALKQQQPLLMAHVHALVEMLRAKCNEGGDEKGGGAFVDMMETYNFATFDITGDLAFGQPLGLLRGRDEAKPWIQAVTLSARFFVVCISAAFYLPPLLNRLANLYVVRSSTLRQKRNKHVGFASSLMRERMATQTDRPDIWTLVVKNYESGTPQLTEGEMRANAATFMAAGTDTTATTLAGATYLLLRNRACYDQLVAEVREAVKSKDDFSMDALARLPYLNAVINESIRVYPSAPEYQARVAPSPQGARICGRHVAAGTCVYVYQYPAFHSHHNFVLPDEFHPERWLDPEDPFWRGDDKKAFQPFSTGPRSCIGKSLAMHEMRLVLAALLWHFDFVELGNGTEDWPKQKAWVVWEKKPLVVKLKPAIRA